MLLQGRMKMGKLKEITIDLESLSEEVIYKYGDYHAGFRELLQNSSDAIKDYQEEYDKDKKFSGFISVTLFPSYIVIKDNGIGLASKEIDSYLLRLYGTDKKDKERAGIFGRGFFAIFKEAKAVYVITRRKEQNKAYLKVYPKDNWFVCEELAFDEIPKKFAEYNLLLDRHGTNLIVIPKSITFNINSIHEYLIQTCRFFELPLVINGLRVNKSFLQAVEDDPNNRAIVDFDVVDKSNSKKRITGCLAYQTANNMIQAFVHRIKVLNLISPVDSVTGYINYDQLKVVPSRDALLKDDSYDFFIKVLSEQCDNVMKKLAEYPEKDDYQALLNYGTIKQDPTYILYVPIYKIIGERERYTIQDILDTIPSSNSTVFHAKKRNIIADRLRKRGYLVVNDFSEKEFQMLEITTKTHDFTLTSVDSPTARSIADLGNRYIIPESQLSSLEKKIVEIVREMVKEARTSKDVRVLLIEGDLIDEAEHVPGQIWLQRRGRFIDLAKKISRYPTLVKMLLSPLICHEITHENDVDIHDETFYENFEANLKKMQELIIQDFLELEKKTLFEV